MNHNQCNNDCNKTKVIVAISPAICRCRECRISMANLMARIAYGDRVHRFIARRKNALPAPPSLLTAEHVGNWIQREYDQFGTN
jgi:hypothetical protein